MTSFNLSKEELVFVGDSLKDAEKARLNEIRFVALCGTFNAEDFHRQDPSSVTINNIKELLKL